VEKPDWERALAVLTKRGRKDLAGERDERKNSDKDILQEVLKGGKGRKNLLKLL